MCLTFLYQCKFFCTYQYNNKSVFSRQRPAFWIYRHIHTHPVVNKTLWFITQRLGVQLHEISIYTPSINEIIETTTYFICLEKRNPTNVFECLVTSCLSMQNVLRPVTYSHYLFPEYYSHLYCIFATCVDIQIQI